MHLSKTLHNPILSYILKKQRGSGKGHFPTEVEVRRHYLTDSSYSGRKQSICKYFEDYFAYFK